MADLNSNEVRVSAEITALTLFVQKLIEELAATDGDIPNKVERAVRARFDESRKTIGE